MGEHSFSGAEHFQIQNLCFPGVGVAGAPELNKRMLGLVSHAQRQPCEDQTVCKGLMIGHNGL